MAEKIILCGLNGAGKSTVGSLLARRLGWVFLDNEEYYFPGRKRGEPYGPPRTKEEVTALLLADLKRFDNCIFASVRGEYGEEAVSLFTRAVYLRAPKELRMRRIRERSFKKFGKRMQPGGDLAESEEEFFRFAEERPEDYVEIWLSTLGIPVIEADGTLPPEENAERLAGLLIKSA